MATRGDSTRVPSYPFQKAAAKNAHKVEQTQDECTQDEQQSKDFDWCSRMEHNGAFQFKKFFY